MSETHGRTVVNKEAAPASVTGRRIVLRPATDADAEWKFNLILRLGIASVPRLDRFALGHAETVAAHFIACDHRSKVRVGYSSLHNADPAGRHVELGVLTDPDCAIPAVGAETFFLTANYAFASLPICKLYMRTTEASAAEFGGTIAAMSRREGTLREHLYFRGRYWDLYVTAVYRDDWLRLGKPIADRISGAVLYLSYCQ
jgi:RimJ/RimL family protein N-acetyltransferase